MGMCLRARNSDETFFVSMVYWAWVKATAVKGGWNEEAAIDPGSKRQMVVTEVGAIMLADALDRAPWSEADQIVRETGALPFDLVSELFPPDHFVAEFVRDIDLMNQGDAEVQGPRREYPQVPGYHGFHVFDTFLRTCGGFIAENNSVVGYVDPEQE